MAAYKAINDEFALQEVFGAPYALAGRVIAIEIKKWQAETLNAEDHLLLFSEEGTYQRGDLEQVFKRDKIQVPVPVAKSFPAVQPADMLAWECFNRLSNPQGEPRANLLRLFEPHKHRGCIATEQDLRAMCETDYGRRRDALNTDKTTIRFASEPKRIRTRSIF